jgi:hypothetical protein
MINDEYTPELELDENKNQEENYQDENQSNSTQDESSEKDDKDWKSEALKLKAILERNKGKAEKVEKKEYSKNSNELDYAEKSYLISNGINREEIKFVQDEYKESGIKDLDTLLDNEYFKSKLEKFRQLKTTKDAVPTGTHSGNITNDSVEYYASKPIEDVPKEFRAKVVNYKLEKESKKGVFYNS